MPARLIGHRIAILADDGVDSDELRELWRTFTDHGADVRLISVYPTQVLAVDARGSVDRFSTDQLVHEVDTANHHALVVPTGRGPHAQLRHHRRVAALARTTVSSGKVLATGHNAAGLLIPAGAARQRYVTSAPQLLSELVRAGAWWTDGPTAHDRGVVTTRRPGARLLAAAVIHELSEPDLVPPPTRDSMCEPVGSVATT